MLPICGNIWWVYPYLIDKNLMSSHKLDFKGGDSFINQPLSITREICKSSDEGFQVRRVFLDISKVFHRVWHDGLIFELHENNISDKLLLLLKDFLKSRKQRVLLNGPHSSWRDVNAGVPHVSILGPLFFLVYINDLSTGLRFNPKPFADDTSLFSQIDLNEDLDEIDNWAYQWKMSFNPIYQRKLKK